MMMVLISIKFYEDNAMDILWFMFKLMLKEI